MPVQVYENIKHMEKKDRVVTLGNFDGVHLAHQELIRRSVELAEGRGLASSVVSFYPHPRRFFNDSVSYINSLEEKKEKIRGLGAEELLLLPFTQELAGLGKEEFVEQILHKALGARVIIVGYNFLFGRNRQGNVENLPGLAAAYGMETIVVPPVMVQEQVVSSSLIRECYGAGLMKEASAYLGYLPSVSGPVIEGRQLGRQLGVPTANVLLDPELLLPGNGIYLVGVKLGQESYHGIANIGTKPTVKADALVELEVHIFDFDRDIYGHRIEVVFSQLLRREQKFPNLEALRKQMELDILSAKQICCVMPAKPI